ncbi:MAG TPA: DUF3159 domain-containing protein [Blastococcus sp.]|nr:DUF3159 domain-containing protein [Blastococcus sp.]
MSTADEQTGTAVPAEGEDTADSGPLLRFDREVVLEQLGGWRGMVDASLPTIAFVVANIWGGLRAGIWAALGLALVVFALRLIRRESIQQAVSGLFAVGVAVAIAAASGQARDFFVFGILRNAVIGVVLVASIPIRWPLVGVFAEFLAPSHLGTMAGQSFPSLRRRVVEATSDPTAAGAGPDTAPSPEAPEVAPDLHWREDRRMVRAYGWLTALWGGTFLARVAVQGLLYQANQVALLGTTSLVLGLPVTAVAIAVTLWVIARLHRHRSAPPARA